MRVLVDKNPKEAIAREIALSIGNFDKVLLLLSGGSALGIPNLLPDDIFSRELIVGMVDERLSIDPEVNNFSKLTETKFYVRAKENGAKFIDSRVKHGEDLNTLSRRIGRALKASGENGYETIALLGVGTDGHTAGIMPFPESSPIFSFLFEDEDSNVIGYDAQNKNPFPHRVTVTNTYLREVPKYSFFYAEGESKRDALEKILSKKSDLHEVPGRIIHEMQNATLITDQLVVLEKNIVDR